MKTFFFVCLGCIATIAFAADFGPPGEPGKPYISEVDDYGFTIKYSAPTSDGGSPILGYVIERKDSGGSRWIRLNANLNPGLTYKDENLMMGLKVEYRVSAENKYGKSRTSKPSDPERFENPYHR